MPTGFRAVLIAAFVAAAAAVAAAPAASAAGAQYDALTVGPKVGAKIPHDLSALDQDGQHRDFRTLARKRGLLILFTRSVDW